MGLCEQLIEIIFHHKCSWSTRILDGVDQILALPLGNWIAKEKCRECLGLGKITPARTTIDNSKFPFDNALHNYSIGKCKDCQGTGIITRPALLSDLEREDVRLRRKDK